MHTLIKEILEKEILKLYSLVETLEKFKPISTRRKIIIDTTQLHIKIIEDFLKEK